MIYCREKLVDIILERPWVPLEDRFDFEVALKRCIKSELFSKSEWQFAENFLATGSDYDQIVERVILTLSTILNYRDENFLKDKTVVARASFYALDKGVRL